MRGRAADSGNIGVKEEEEEEESLSLCDLPINEGNQSRKDQSSSNIAKPAIESQEEFNFFCDSLISKESEMCAADEVFFQGQILPLRHSVSCDGGFSTRLQSDIRNASRCLSRSDSLDHCYSGGLTSASSRSSSINSHHSSSSGSSSAATTTNSKQKKPRPPRVPNHFQYSHPSPKPQIRSSSIKKNSNSTNSNRSSGLWSLFRVGLMTQPEIAIRDLKNRSNSIRNNPQSFGSRNSTSSSISTCSNSSKIIPAKRKQPLISFNRNGVLFGGCKCTVSSVGPNPSRIAVNRRSGVTPKEAAANAHAEEEEKQHAMKMTKHHPQAAGKQALSSHRTFEWLKQLSLEAAMDQT